MAEQLAGLGASAARVEHRRRSLVGEQFGRALEDGEEPLMDRPQQEGGLAHPVCKGRAIKIEALSGIDLGLSVKRKVIEHRSRRSRPRSIIRSRKVMTGLLTHLGSASESAAPSVNLLSRVLLDDFVYLSLDRFEVE